MFVCAGNNESFSFAHTIGVGLIESASNLTKICMRENVDEIIFIGSAGAYDTDLNILDLHVCFAATQIEHSLFQGNSYTPLQNFIQSNAPFPKFLARFLQEHNNIVSCGTKHVNSSNYITIDSQMAKVFFMQGISLENMEFFSVLQIANFFKIPCCGIFCVSNYCASSAHEEFLHNHKSVKAKLEAFCMQLCDRAKSRGLHG
ncbi:purine-nucleoside phosphorylase [Helicobacter sp. 10-6591]|uniref:5'-methylthioadenosine/S-adenosylhomocysteine nucleosidase family protein n=1 Tax=Helicobacter sp. 10-6591 TaxID=2004998 RepID=UPI000DCCD4B5|nr:purine-nucleoside phosphorylase [Helicobacter sp. 10-6591]MCI7485601.1 purine-nucleoside phosphorylase [Helicobacter sp.]RAX56058.1 hypothetical protein CCY97_01790 [Helicobacter sp. 10-6591]